MRTPAFALDSHQIHTVISELAGTGRDSVSIDGFIRQYYRSGGPLVWVSRLGVDERADVFLQQLRQVGEMGLTERAFGVEQIEADYERMRTLHFDDEANTISNVAGRLEYRLTRAWLRYVSGQRFGFTNPNYILNRVDADLTDTLGNAKTFRRLYDVALERPNPHFYTALLRQVANDSVAEALADSRPVDSLFYRLQRELPKAENDDARKRILVNMERCRWRYQKAMPKNGKRVIVNIPAFHLYAIGPGEKMEMRVGCGTTKTKTPQLVSEIERMDVNPNWIIPMSIVETDVAHHAGDPSYFSRHRYFIYNRQTGEHVSPEATSRSMLLSGDYRVAQEGGAGNSLGRIVFRFANNFSVFLHDTSTRAFFSRDNRGVSHGCVRVERPFDLARFLLNSPDAWLLDRLRISMGMQPETQQGIDFVHSHPNEDDRKLIHSHNVSPRVPLYIIYFTIYPDLHDQLQYYPDVYGFDGVVYQHLQPYMR
ncbi:MAG: L,D-transpeptidase family protein [Prevotella sp.]|nr:L,D-transpeptidase family protein [Prevotella sp.]